MNTATISFHSPVDVVNTYNSEVVVAVVRWVCVSLSSLTGLRVVRLSDVGQDISVDERPSS